MLDKNKLNNSCPLSGTRLSVKINEPCFRPLSQLLITHLAQTRFVFFSLYRKKGKGNRQELKKIVYFCVDIAKKTMRYRLFLYCLTISAFALARTNRALIISIGTYPIISGWEKIHADNDRRLVTEMLLSYQYQPENIKVLSDAHATRKVVIAAFQHCWEQTASGDFIYLHFSCHGQQMMDDNGDEEDGLDESLVLYDASYWYMPGKYEGENHLRDDELGIWINRLRKKAGNNGQVTVVLDACHSGTGNRDNGANDYVRGASAVFAPEGYIPKPGSHQELSLKLKSVDGLAPAFVFSACLANEINYEYYSQAHKEFYGMLTYAFYSLFRSNGNFSSVAEFMEALQKQVNQLTGFRKSRKQTVYMECSNENIPFQID